MTLLDEVAHGEGILVSIARGKSLVGHIEECVVLASLDGVADFLPLLWCRINTSGVVCASMEQEDGVLGSGLDVRNHALKVEADGVLVVIAVFLNGQTGVLEHSTVVSP